MLDLIANVYLWTWFVWPVVFVFSFLYAIHAIIKDDKSPLPAAIIASVSLLIILGGITNLLLI